MERNGGSVSSSDGKKKAWKTSFEMKMMDGFFFFSGLCFCEW